MSWADIALGNRSAQPAMQDKTGKWIPAPTNNGMVQAYDQTGSAPGQAVGTIGMQSQPGIDQSRLFNGSNWNPNAPPIFNAADIQYRAAQAGNPNVSGVGQQWNAQTAAGMAPQAAGWTTPGSMTGRGTNWQINQGQPNTDPNGFNLAIKDSSGAAQNYGYTLDPTGKYWIPAAQGTRIGMDTNNWADTGGLQGTAFLAGGVYGATALGAAGGAAPAAGEVGTTGGAVGGTGLGGGSGAVGAAAPAVGGGLGGGVAAGGGEAVAAGGAAAAPAAGSMLPEGANAAAGAQAGGNLAPAASQAGGYMNSLGQWVPLAGAVIGAIGANRAAGQQADAANAATQLQRDIYTQNRADLAPWRQAGGQNLARLQYLMGQGDQGTPGGAGGGDYGSLMRDFSMQDYQQDPGYQFRMQQGEQAINRNALARGRYNSGSVLKSLQDFNSGLASQEYGNAFNRFQTQRGTRLNALQAGSGINQSGVPQTATLGQNFGQQAGANMIGAGNANAAGTMGITNAFSQGLGQYYNNQQSQQALQQNQQWQDNMLNALRGNQYGNNTGYQAYSGGA